MSLFRLALLLLFILAGCALEDSRPVVPDGWTAPRFAPLADAIRTAGEVQLLEGLPHQLVEHGSFQRELTAKATVEVGGYRFYRQALPLTARDAAALRAVCVAPETYHPYTGPKVCGGFHPDYCVVWREGSRTSYALICFGCHEIENLGAGRELRADLPGSAFHRLQAILRPYHAQRPPYQRGG